MTWTRIKRWIGTHPVLIVNTVTVVWLLAFINEAFHDVLWGHVPYPNPMLHEAHKLFVRALCYVPWLYVIAFVLPPVVSTFLVGCVVCRAGGRAARLTPCLAWTLALSTALIPTSSLIIRRYFEAELGRSAGLITPLSAVAAGSGVGVILAALQAAGIRLAHLFARRQVRRGRWEVTAPLVDGDKKEGRA